MRQLLSPVLFLCLFAASMTAAGNVTGGLTVVKIQPAQSHDDVSYPYYQDLLSLVLKRTEAGFGPVTVIPVDVLLSQSRAFNTLKSGALDVFWAGTNVARETQFTAIRIPLFRGLLGLRVPVILKSRADEFARINDANQLKKLVACQGAQWPDSDILQANGYKVERITKFSVMYSMLKQGRCDYFPRGLNEVYAELQGADKSELMAFDGLLLSYTFPMYFFVAKDNEVLAERLEQGLENLVAGGELQEFLETHQTTRNIFPLSKFDHSKIFYLDNSSLPELTPLNRPELWLLLRDHQ